MHLNFSLVKIRSIFAREKGPYKLVFKVIIIKLESKTTAKDGSCAALLKFGECGILYAHNEVYFYMERVKWCDERPDR